MDQRIVQRVLLDQQPDPGLASRLRQRLAVVKMIPACLAIAAVLSWLVICVPALRAAGSGDPEVSYGTEVERILSEKDSVAAVEALVALGNEATTAILEVLYRHPEEALGALLRVADSRATSQVVDYLYWAESNLPDSVPEAVLVLQRIADPQSVERLRDLLIDPELRPEHKLHIADALLEIGEPVSSKDASRSLIAMMDDPATSRRARVSAARVLLRHRVGPARALARTWFLAVVDRAGSSELSLFLGEGETDGWYQGFETELIETLGEMAGPETDSRLRLWLNEADLMVHQGTNIVDILLTTADPHDEAAILDWAERLAGHEYREVLLAMQTLDRVASTGPISDSDRFVAIVKRLQSVPAEWSAESRLLLERLHRTVEQLESRPAAEE